MFAVTAEWIIKKKKCKYDNICVVETICLVYKIIIHVQTYLKYYERLKFLYVLNFVTNLYSHRHAKPAFEHRLQYAKRLFPALVGSTVQCDAVTVRKIILCIDFTAI